MTTTTAPRINISPEFDPSTRTRTYRVTVAWESGSSSAYRLPTVEAARAKGAEIVASLPVQGAATGRLLAVAGAGRLMGR